ncbi:hypothetical protein QTH49_13375 [Clostridium perfringens]|nr:hypothetical protein [Clostridium perfringens]MDM0528446.1 hypothetical protein [Clostridium perfringens]
MEKCLYYRINADYMRTRGNGLADLTKKWLNEQGIDVIVDDFILGEDANIIIDFSFDLKVKREKVILLTEQLFERFKIEFELDN